MINMNPADLILIIFLLRKKEGSKVVVDFHTHLFPEKIAEKTVAMLADRGGLAPHTNGTALDLIREMNEDGADLSIVLPVVTSPKQFDSIIRFAVKLNETYQTGEKRILSFGGIHPMSGHYKEELKELKQLGFLGIKLHPDYQDGVYFDDMRYKRIVDAASDLGLIVSVHTGVDVGLPDPVRCTPQMALSVIRDVHPPKLVLAHLGGWKCWDEVEELLVGEDVYFDTAVAFGFCPEEQMLRIIRNHGADRILFATDSPWSGQRQSLKALNGLGVTKEEKEKICYKNAYHLLGIKE